MRVHPRSGRVIPLIVAVLVVVVGAGGAWPLRPTRVAAAGGGGHWPVPKRASGIVRQASAGAEGAPAGAVTCSLPGPTDWVTDCASHGLPVNEPSIAARDGLMVAGANDYNSYNTNAQLGFFWSSDGRWWRDDGFLDLFPHAPDNGAGDPGLAIDGHGVVYYSSILFSYTECSVGGLELVRRDPSTGRWSYRQIADNTANRFNDKPAIAIDDRHVYQAWTEFDFCPRQQPPHLELLKVAVSPLGVTPGVPTRILTVPGAQHTEGAAIAPDGEGGFWLAWEEFKNNLFTRGQIRLIHHDPRVGWSPFRVISPPSFRDLPIPLPGFRFTTNSFPAMAVSMDGPNVVWCSYDTGVGRTYRWAGGRVRVVKDSGDDQFFPAIVARGNRVSVTFSQTDRARRSFGQYLVRGGRASRISTGPSFPNRDDTFLHGTFIGDYSGMAVAGSMIVPVWTDVRRPAFDENTMVFVP